MSGFPLSLSSCWSSLQRSPEVPAKDSMGALKTAPVEAPSIAHPVTRGLEKAVQEGLFTAWSCANAEGALSIFFADESYPLLATGADAPPTPHHPLFDLASLTKPLFTNLLLRRIMQEQPLDVWTRPLTSLLAPRTQAGEALASWLEVNHAQLSLSDLLNHTSGAKAWFWFGRGAWAFKPKAKSSGLGFAKAHQDQLGPGCRAKAFALRLTLDALASMSPQGQQPTVYSDLNYFLLTRVAENLATTPIIEWSQSLAALNDSLGTSFFHASLTPHASRHAVPFFPYVAHESGTLSGTRGTTDASGALEFGPASDTNANILGTLGHADNLVSGHAGLFGSVLDVGLALNALARSQTRLLAQGLAFCDQNPAQRRHFDTDQRFVFGLDTPSSGESLAGLQRFPLNPEARVFGHLGYSGTSAWFSVHADSVPGQKNILLTNRTAHRTRFGVSPVPRIAVQTHFSSGQTQTFLVKPHDAGFEPLSPDDAQELLHTHFHGTCKLWDHGRLRPVPDIAAVRRQTGRLLWNL